ncbi:hypothetical protein BU25DRAFT_200455 [Macroventuria anomochaeta]|uniref:Uncharacterized protein n=1 Tax=Macroventuria anomochaeta TaxID=301207 RepID=A0ACB6RME1_9PLEO|nr:uncharacterized protein BU25DRAFT_200455 [Macroventuria anomochaeta]KAF2623041.1 hypothetical protein BU25DRAFT_200455 [Macroventuria anomochaeta]
MKSTEGTEPPHKRSRTSEDADDAAVASGGKKARGRPRVDTQDATAADRRRTQIRLAQRAYRQRKETTISSLKQQSSQLHNTIDEMNKAFLRLNNSIVQSGVLQLNPGLARELQQMTEMFANCVKSANERTVDSDEDEPGEAAPMQKKEEAPAPSKMVQAQSSQTITPLENEQPWGYAVITQATEQTRSQSDIPQAQSYLSHISSSSYKLPEPNNESSLARRYQFTVGEVLDQSRSRSGSYQPRATDDQTQQEQQQEQQLLPFGLVDLPNREQSPFVPPYIFPVNFPAMGAELPPAPRQSPKTVTYPLPSSLTTKTLSPGYTYSYEEVTFARRLMRATLEFGFLLLCNPDVHPAILSYIFKLSLPYVTLEEIRTRFKVILSRDVTEDLDWYATPFLHLGGAGTHYQRRDAHGKPIPMKNNWTIRQIGPLERRMVRMESVANGQIQDFESLDLNGFEGEWFDAYDVQGYLEEQWHCRIDPKSSFAECLVEDENAAILDETESPSLSRDSTSSTSDTTMPPVPHTFNALEPSYGLDMPLNNAPTPNFLLSPPKQSLLNLSFNQTLGLDLAPGFDLGFAGNSGYSTLGLNMTGETEQLPVMKQKPKKVAWVDVHKLIENIIKQAVCLGRAPGYRRKDIDVAFREALIPAY